MSSIITINIDATKARPISEKHRRNSIYVSIIIINMKVLIIVILPCIYNHKASENCVNIYMYNLPLKKTFTFIISVLKQATINKFFKIL